MHVKNLALMSFLALFANCGCGSATEPPKKLTSISLDQSLEIPELTEFLKAELTVPELAYQEKQKKAKRPFQENRTSSIKI